MTTRVSPPALPNIRRFMVTGANSSGAWIASTRFPKRTFAVLPARFSFQQTGLWGSSKMRTPATEVRNENLLFQCFAPSLLSFALRFRCKRAGMEEDSNSHAARISSPGTEAYRASERDDHLPTAGPRASVHRCDG